MNRILHLAFIKECADAGDASALLLLGFLDEHGHASASDCGGYIACYRKAAQAGDAVAQFAMALAYQAGQGVSQSNDEAFAWAERAARQGLPLALHALASYYERGIGVERDIARAKQLLEQAAAAGSTRAAGWLGIALTEGLLGEENDAEALKWTGVAANQNDPFAVHELATRFENGQGVPHDEKRAIALYERAAQLGNSFSALRLFSIYSFGELGQAVDAEKAKYYSALEARLRSAFLDLNKP